MVVVEKMERTGGRKAARGRGRGRLRSLVRGTFVTVAAGEQKRRQGGAGGEGRHGTADVPTAPAGTRAFVGHGLGLGI